MTDADKLATALDENERLTGECRVLQERVNTAIQARDEALARAARLEELCDEARKTLQAYDSSTGESWERVDNRHKLIKAMSLEANATGSRAWLNERIADALKQLSTDMQRVEALWPVTSAIGWRHAIEYVSDSADELRRKDGA